MYGRISAQSTVAGGGQKRWSWKKWLLILDHLTHHKNAQLWPDYLILATLSTFARKQSTYPIGSDDGDEEEDEEDDGQRSDSH